MSKFAKDGNSFRREWDKEAFEKRAKERLERETELEEEREELGAEAAPYAGARSARSATPARPRAASAPPGSNVSLGDHHL